MWIVSSFLRFFLAYGRVKFFNETVNFLHRYRKFKDLPYHCLDKSHAPVVNNTATCDKPVGMLAAQGTT